ncbi:hypothetical protein H4CHR_02158 [Variovorax sp. PBS-H4]|nr:hypothetical protein H4CHR_02158 [Variovorax sp. PBS-H4]
MALTELGERILPLVHSLALEHEGLLQDIPNTNENRPAGQVVDASQASHRADPIRCCTVLMLFLGIELFGLPLVPGEPQGLSVLSTYLFKVFDRYCSDGGLRRCSPQSKRARALKSR